MNLNEIENKARQAEEVKKKSESFGGDAVGLISDLAEGAVEIVCEIGSHMGGAVGACFEAVGSIVGEL